MAVSLIVDGDHQMHRSLHLDQLRALKTKRTNQPTGIVFGIINILRRVINSVDDRVDQVYFLLGGRGNWRRDVDPMYKYRNPEDAQKWTEVKEGEEFSYNYIFNFSRQVIQDWMDCLGVRVLFVDGHEADDLSFLLAEEIRAQGRSPIAVSDDFDWLQLVNNPGIPVYQPMKELLVEEHNFKEITGVPKEAFVLQLSVEGGHDNIPKLQEGLGSKGISNMINKLPEGCYSPEDIRKWARTQTAKKFKALDDCKKMIRLRRNIKLVDLSRVPFSEKTLNEVREHMNTPYSFDRERFEEFVKEYELTRFSGLKGQPTFRSLT